MSIESMTGFAREEGAHEAFSWRWEVRSVNNRGLDIRVRLPSGMEALEIQARDQASKKFKRGSFNLNLNLTAAPEIAGYKLNEDLLNHVLAIAETVQAKTGAKPPQVDGLLRLRGILEAEEATDSDAVRRSREQAMVKSLGSALDKIAEARREEGARMLLVLLGFVDEIETLSGAARTLAAAQPDAIAARVKNQIAEFLEASQSPPEDRLAQEIAMMVGKADIREEIDRLDAHIAQARELLASGDAVGRRLDFLSQEFNREANTLCSKSQDLELTRTGLALKAAIEQFREQVQNIQ
ncbi:MAG: YicC family protein [Rhodospirillales bacterium]|jgi:uncharacterized protein (TIGR00255 family)|nr:YicC family protein [Rhodospirillales bacterium]MBT4007521.1 YicC family protein [Rhodospirillales bacterium]MBT5077178.1 YicC family protein [Rhodospirillales bacterium]MBT5113235.1 YicC family protein [Rhodospirillales bacterium]MBT5671868.1 YicC family protein [Rhodospirillales bacterium]